MNAVAYAVARIKHRIPEKVLTFAYLDDYGQVETIESIMEGVIKRGPIMDSNLMSGVQMNIPLKESYVIAKGAYGEKTVSIPDDVLRGRTITSALSVTQSHTVTGRGYASASIYVGSDVLESATKMYGNSSSPGIITTANLEVIGHSTVAILDHIGMLDGFTMNITVENESKMTNMNDRAKMAFMQLCTFAIKADIYNKSIVKMEEGEIVQGHRLGKTKEIIDSYSDADTQYYEFFEDKWRKVLHMMDPTAMRKTITLSVPNNA